MIQLSIENKKKLIEELKFISNKFEKEPTLKGKSFYLSGVHPLLNRIINLEFNNELLLLNFVFQGLHGIFDNLINKIEQGVEKIITIPEEFFPELSKLLNDIANAIEKKKDLYPYVQRASLFAHILTGNGFYLYQRGVMLLTDQKIKKS
jgi:hypothetical protein